MKLTTTIFAGMLLLLSGQLFAQESDWNYVSTEDIVNRDSITKKGYTLIFINKSPSFSEAVKSRMVDAFFTVYPKEAKMYNKKTRRKVTFIIDPKYTGVAAAAGGIIRFNPTWFVSHPGDIDVVTHEVMHIVQSYPCCSPGWLVEGVADYVRYKMGVDNAGAGWTLTPFNATQSYTNAYRITARFLVWVEKSYSKKLVKTMDDAMRNNTYTPALWTAVTGKTVDELWKEYSLNPVL